MRKLLKWLAIIVGSFFAIVVIVGVMAGRENAGPPRVSDAQLETFDAGQLAKSYEANTVAADQRFKGHRFKVTGRVMAISTDFMGDPYVTLDAGANVFLHPQFSFSKADAGMVSGLAKGDQVTLACKGRGDVAKVPMSGECKRL